MIPKTLIAFLLGNSLSASLLLGIFKDTSYFAITVFTCGLLLLPIVVWLIDDWGE